MRIGAMEIRVNGFSNIRDRFIGLEWRARNCEEACVQNELWFFRVFLSGFELGYEHEV